MEQRLGFKLFGNTYPSDGNGIDSNQTYEIHFFPGQIPLGTLFHLIKQDERSIPVELPQELRQAGFEKICSYFLEKEIQLIVKEYGYEKLGNRKLVVEASNDHKEPLVNMRICIEGQSYKIELNPHDLNSSIGAIQNSKECRKVDINLDELKTIKKCDIKKVFPKLKPNNFYISTESDQITIELALPLKQYMESLGKPSKYRTAKKIEKSQDEKPLASIWSFFKTSKESPPSIAEEKQLIHSPSVEEIPPQPKEEKEPSKHGVWPIFKKMFGKT